MNGARTIRSSSRASARLAPRVGGRDRALQRPHLGGEILDLGSGAGPGAVQRHRPVEPDLELVAQRGRAAGLGLGLLDVGAALVGVEPQQHVAELDLLPFLEADLLDDAGALDGDGDRLVGAHGADGVAELDDPAGAHGVDVDDRRRGLRRRSRGRPLPGEARRIAADERKPRQRPVLMGKPTRVAGSPEHGDEGELSVPAHARFPHDPIVMAWLLLAILAREKQMMCNTFFIFWDRG